MTINQMRTLKLGQLVKVSNPKRWMFGLVEPYQRLTRHMGFNMKTNRNEIRVSTVAGREYFADEIELVDIGG